MVAAARRQRGFLLLVAAVAVAAGFLFLRALLVMPSAVGPRPAGTVAGPAEPWAAGPTKESGTPSGTAPAAAGAGVTAVQVRIDPFPTEPSTTGPAGASTGNPAASTHVSQPPPAVAQVDAHGNVIASVAPPDSDRHDRP